MILPALVLILSFGVDRVFGDPHTPFHPVALVGRFIAWWGRPGLYPDRYQRGIGVLFWGVTAVLFTLPFLLFSWFAPWYVWIFGAPFLLKSCFALRSLEEHAFAVADAVDPTTGRMQAGMLVSRNVAGLTDEQVLSAAYESVAENLNDSIIAPVFYFVLFGLPGAALYRAVNTMDAMLGYRDERVRLGWCAARMDDILSYIPARISGLLLLVRYAWSGRLGPAVRILKRDRKKRPGYNGGIPMSLIAGGEAVMFDKPGAYRIGDPGRSLGIAGPDIIRTVRIVSVMVFITAGSALILFPLPFNI